MRQVAPHSSRARRSRSACRSRSRCPSRREERRHARSARCSCRRRAARSTRSRPTRRHNSTCDGACAQTWPPVLVDKGWTRRARISTARCSARSCAATARRQLVAGQWPLYTFSGDTKPGDVNGEGSGGVWFAVGTNAKLVKHAPSSPTTAARAAATDGRRSLSQGLMHNGVRQVPRSRRRFFPRDRRLAHAERARDALAESGCFGENCPLMRGGHESAEVFAGADRAGVPALPLLRRSQGSCGAERPGLSLLLGRRSRSASRGRAVVGVAAGFAGGRDLLRHLRLLVVPALRGGRSTR